MRWKVLHMEPGKFTLKLLGAVLFAAIVGCSEREGQGAKPWEDYAGQVGLKLPSQAEIYRQREGDSVFGRWHEYAIRSAAGPASSCADLGISGDADFEPYDTYRSILFDDVFKSGGTPTGTPLCHRDIVVGRTRLSVYSNLHYTLLVVRISK